MKSTKFSAGVIARRLAAITALGAFAAPASAATITKSYSFDGADLISGLQNAPGTPVTYENNVTVPGTGFSLIDPNASSSLTYIKHSWVSKLSIPDSFAARIDAGVPADYILQSISITYNLNVVNWVAMDNNNPTAFTAADHVGFTVSSTAGIYRSFSGTASAPAGTLVDSVTGSQTVADLAFPATEADGTPTTGGADFPFANTFIGADAKIWAPNGANQAHPGPGAGETINDVLTRNQQHVDIPLAGADFTYFQGVGPIGTPGANDAWYSATGTGSATSADNFSLAFRAFSYGDFSITFTFVPEPGTWAAGGIVLLSSIAAVSRRRKVQRT